MTNNADRAQRYSDLERHDKAVKRCAEQLEEFNGRVPFDDKVPNVKRLAEFLVIENEITYREHDHGW